MRIETSAIFAKQPGGPIKGFQDTGYSVFCGEN